MFNGIQAGEVVKKTLLGSHSTTVMDDMSTGSVEAGSMGAAAPSDITIQTYDSLTGYAREKLAFLFPGNIYFSFVFGDVVKHRAAAYHAFNIFICLNERDPSQEHVFRTLLLEEQIRQGLYPDDKYSVEIVSKSMLDEAFTSTEVEQSDLQLAINSDCFRLSYIFSDRKEFIHGEAALLHPYAEKCSALQEALREQLAVAVQGGDALALLKSMDVDQSRVHFESQKSELVKSIMSIYRVEIAPEELKKIILAFFLTQIAGVLKKLEEERPELTSQSTRVMLDGADGSFETYRTSDLAYSETSSDLRRYIPFAQQYTFGNSTRDRRKTLMHFAIQTGIAPQTMMDDLDSIVTGLGSGYILSKSIQAINNKNGHVFLIPVPTYGYFIPAIAACGATPLFVDTTPYPRFALPPKVLDQIILKNNNELYKTNIKKFIQEFTKFINDLESQGVLIDEIRRLVDFSGRESNTHKMAVSFQKYIAAHYKELKGKYPALPESVMTDFPELPRVKCLFFINPHNPLGIVFEQDYINAIAEIASRHELTIIDDLSHMELVYKQEPPINIGFFNQAPYPLDVITLVSPSKALCMAECRVGFALINNTQLVASYKELVFNDGVFLSTKQLVALEASFVLNEDRARYIRRNAAEYQFRMEMVQYIFHPELRGELSATSLNRIRIEFEQYGVNIDNYRQGVPGIQLLNSKPESGMFCVLDFTSIKGKYFVHSPINTNQDLWALLRIFNINALTGDNIYYTDRLVIRFPICELPVTLFLAIERLRRMMGLISRSPCIKEMLSNEVKQTLVVPASAHNMETVSVTQPVVCQVPILLRQLAEVLTRKSESIRRILAEYQTDNVTDYEIERSLRTLREMNVNTVSLNERIDAIAVMLPSNLPLYSLFIFVIIPSLLSQRVYVRPNSILQQYDTISRLAIELELNTLLPGIQIVNQNRDGFLNYIKTADLVIYTGRPANAEKFLQDMKEDAILVVNGAGHNPLVVTDSANVDDAVEGALLVKGFNGGQDCAGPDAILVHESIAAEFISKFQERFSRLKTGAFSDPATVIGPIHRLTELQRLAEVMHVNREDIVTGGAICFRQGIVFPTTVIRAIERRPNYKEIYGPITFIHPYKTDEDLALYFDDPDGQYQANRMYVSVYGDSVYLNARDDASMPGRPGNAGIVLRNKNIHEVEIGYNPYGGYSLGASAIVRKRASKRVERVAMPILVTDIIRSYLINGEPLPSFTHTNAPRLKFFPSTTKTGTEIESIVNEFKALAVRAFGNNLLFGFIFGSAAKGVLKTHGPDSDDLDTFICIRESSPSALQSYLDQLAQLHAKYRLKVDAIFPAEVMTLETLQDVVSGLEHVNVSVDKLVTGQEFDHIFWMHALTDIKTGFLGDNSLMLGLICQARPHLNRWSRHIIEQLLAKEDLPAYLKEKFSGLTKQQVIEKLKNANPHFVVHLGLQYDTGVPAVSGISAGA